jgi:hypothetical protein
MGTRYGKSGWVVVAAVAAALLPSLAASRAEAQIVFNEIARFSLGTTATNPYGANPTSVAWSGGKLYVAGYSVTAGGTAAIVEVTNPTATGLVNATLSSPFGSGTAASTRGYTGLYLKDGFLGASFDLGANSPKALQGFNAATNTFVWDLAASGTNASNVGSSRGMARLGYDPGYNGNPAQGSGFSWINQGSGRRPTNRIATGVPEYLLSGSAPANPTAALGYIFNNNAASNNWRAMAFDPATGDFYGITNNQVVKAVRNDANTIASGTTLVIVAQTAANNIVTNIAYLDGITAKDNNPYSGDALIFNNRDSTANGQVWTSVIKVSTNGGAAVAPTWNFLSAVNTGNGAYDFSWDSATETLAVMDFSNRTVSIFSVPEPSTWAMLVIGGGVGGLATLRRRISRKETLADGGDGVAPRI